MHMSCVKLLWQIATLHMVYENKIWVPIFKFMLLNRSPKLIRCSQWWLFLEAQWGNLPHASSWLLLVDNSHHSWTQPAPVISTSTFTLSSFSICAWVYLSRPSYEDTSQTASKAHALTQGHPILIDHTHLQRRYLEKRMQPEAEWTGVWERHVPSGHGHMLVFYMFWIMRAQPFCSCAHSCVSAVPAIHRLPSLCLLNNEGAFDVGPGSFLEV